MKKFENLIPLNVMGEEHSELVRQLISGVFEIGYHPDDLNFWKQFAKDRGVYVSLKTLRLLGELGDEMYNTHIRLEKVAQRYIAKPEEPSTFRDI